MYNTYPKITEGKLRFNLKIYAVDTEKRKD